jgi:hypothetical protein
VAGSPARGDPGDSDGASGHPRTVGPVLKTVTGIEAYNTSRLNLRAILADPGHVAGNLRAALQPKGNGRSRTAGTTGIAWPPQLHRPVAFEIDTTQRVLIRVP